MHTLTRNSCDGNLEAQFQFSTQELNFWVYSFLTLFRILKITAMDAREGINNLYNHTKDQPLN